MAAAAAAFFQPQSLEAAVADRTQTRASRARRSIRPQLYLVDVAALPALPWRLVCLLQFATHRLLKVHYRLVPTTVRLLTTSKRSAMYS